MGKFIVQGGNKLSGEISVSGAKNMATKILAVSLMSEQTMKISRVPEIEDVKRLLEILEELGVKIERVAKGEYHLVPKNIDLDKFNYDLVSQFRASILLLGPLLARFKKVKFPHPGGCIIGKRPIDLFVKGFKALGAKITEHNEYYEFDANGLIGAKIVFPQMTVTGTETLMLAAVFAKGTTTLINAAHEPEIRALADYLNCQGAKITGAGTNTVVIEGVAEISAGEVEIIPDRIETGSYVALALATKSNIKITNCHPHDILIPLELAKQMGADITIGEDYIDIKAARELKAINIKTHEYPGFATDLQAPFTVLLTQSKGQSLVHETVFEGRLFYTDFLSRMGANILMCDPQRVLITGPTQLIGKKLESPDLRAGIAMVIAGLIAKGETEIENIYQVERGYEDLMEKLKGIGADITRQD